MGDTRIIKSVKFNNETGGHTCVEAITSQDKMVPLFSFYPEDMNFDDTTFVGRSVSWARKIFIAKNRALPAPMV